jgi:hypothetical protein
MVRSRAERLLIMLDREELLAIDDFRFNKRMPSRAAAVRELLKRGLAAEGFSTAAAGAKSLGAIQWLDWTLEKVKEIIQGRKHHRDELRKLMD